MEPFSVLSGVAVPLDEANLDTNQICPTRFNKCQKGPVSRRFFFMTGDLMPTALKSPITCSIKNHTVTR